MSSQSLLVEFVGLPGSGKTTVANKIISLARLRGAAVKSGAEVLKSSKSKNNRFSNFCRDPLFSSLFYFSALRLPPRRFFRMRGVNGFLCETFAFKQKVANNFGEIVVVDEGLIHHFYSMARGADPFHAAMLLSELASRYYNGLSHQLVYCCLDPEICIERFKARIQDSSSFNRGTPDAAIEAFRKSNVIYSLLLKSYLKVNPNKIWTLDIANFTHQDEKSLIDRLLTLDGR